MRHRRGPAVDPNAEDKKLVGSMLAPAKVRFATSFIDEPLLVFSNGNTTPDCRVGLREFGAWQTGQRGGANVTLGVIGTGQGINGLINYLETTRSPVNAGINRKQKAYDPALFPEFPGWDKGGAYGVDFECPEHFRRQVLEDYFKSALRNGSVEVCVKAIVELVSKEMASLSAFDPSPRVVVVVLPECVEDALRFVGVQSRNQVLPATPAEKALKKQSKETEKTGQAFFDLPFDNADAPAKETVNYWNLHHAIKAHTMKLGIPLQIVWQSTLLGESQRQDPASTAWNLMTALFYKAGNIPWQPVGLPSDTCYIGISFYRVGQGKGAETHTSFAQVFGAREGLIMKGERAVIDKTRGDKSPHLSESGAEKLIKGAIDLYTQSSGSRPKRVVVHKTSRYWPEELGAMKRGLGDVQHFDFLALERLGIRFFRMGDKPPIRGTVVQLTAKRFLVFTGGYIPFLKAYPGFRVPHPVDVVEHFGESPIELLAKEILILTKLNWNSCAFASSQPITVRFARSVGTILTSLPAGVEPEAKYRFYM